MNRNLLFEMWFGTLLFVENLQKHRFIYIISKLISKPPGISGKLTRNLCFTNGYYLEYQQIIKIAIRVKLNNTYN